MKAGVCLSVRLSVRLCVTQLLPQFWTEWASKDIFWNPHAKGQVLRHFWSNSEEKQISLPFWPNHLSILWKQQWVCPSVCLSVCAYIIYFFGFDQISPEKIFMDSLQKGPGFKTFLVKFWRKKRIFSFRPNHLSILWKQVSVCPSVCPSVCSNTIYSLIFCPIQSTRILLETACQRKGFKIISSYNYQEIERKIQWLNFLEIISILWK